LTEITDEWTVDRTAFTVVALDEDQDERMYWGSRTPEERLRHLEYLRRINYGNRTGERLQRVLEVVEFTPR
jgi:hypothetical protein